YWSCSSARQCSSPREEKHIVARPPPWRGSLRVKRASVATIATARLTAFVHSNLISTPTAMRAGRSASAPAENGSRHAGDVTHIVSPSQRRRLVSWNPIKGNPGGFDAESARRPRATGRAAAHPICRVGGDRFSGGLSTRNRGHRAGGSTGQNHHRGETRHRRDRLVHRSDRGGERGTSGVSHPRTDDRAAGQCR